MKLRLLALVPWMVLAGAAFGQVRKADVLFTYREATPQPGYRVDDECFVAVETTELWGWKNKIEGSEDTIEAEGHTLHLTLRSVADSNTIPLRVAIKQLGGQSDWDAASDTLSVYSVLSTLTVQGGKVHAAAPMAFKTTPFYLNPDRTVIDLLGVRLGPDLKPDLPTGARAFQYRPNVVRVLLNTKYVPKLPATPLAEDQTLDLDLGQPKVQTPVVAPQTTPFPDTVPPIGVPAPGPAEDLSVSVDTDTDSTTSIGLHLSQKFQGQAQVQRPDPDTLQITLPGVSNLSSQSFTANTKAVQSITAEPHGRDTVLTITLARPMGAELISSYTGVSLILQKPTVGDGHIAGKIIVVDPGHGGHDSGTHDSGYNEKDITLKVGLKLAAKLAKEGATVIMTRQTDVFIPLMTRSVISNNNHADFFISCHVNSTGDSSRQSGSITFYHLSNSIAYLLAASIQHEIAKVNKLPNLGAWSDGKIYETGFSVLRHTNAPAVLVEMGFLNNPHDRARILTDDFQEAVSTAIVRGIRVYLGDLKPNE